MNANNKNTNKINKIIQKTKNKKMWILKIIKLFRIKFPKILQTIIIHLNSAKKKKGFKNKNKWKKKFNFWIR